MRISKMSILRTLTIGLFAAATVACSEDAINGIDGADGADGVDGKDLTEKVLTPLESSITPVALVKVNSNFPNANLEVIMSSEDILPSSPEFIYGSMADGAGLLKDGDNYQLIQNIERDYAVARITLNSDLKPLKGEYIMDAYASGYSNMCSATLATPEEHGFGPLFLTGAEWQGAYTGVFAFNPMRPSSSKSFATFMSAMGEWSAENAVPIGKDAYGKYTVVFIGDDEADSNTPMAQFAMFIGEDQFGNQDARMGNLSAGKRYVLKFADSNSFRTNYEGEMSEGQTIDVEWVEIDATLYDDINTECVAKDAIGFNRIADIDWRRGSSANQREIYFNVTGRDKSGLTGTEENDLGRVYKLVMNETDPKGPAKLTCILDGDDSSSKAYTLGLHSPDNITVTENYVYVQEDPNGYASNNPNIGTSGPKIYQYDIVTKNLKIALECDQAFGSANGYGLPTTGSTSKYWEIGGMIDITDVIGASEPTFLLATQNHGWQPSNNGDNAKRADNATFTDPNANPDLSTSQEGSVLFKVTGLGR
jgi:hypothetical protein